MLVGNGGDDTFIADDGESDRLLVGNGGDDSASVDSLLDDFSEIEHIA